MLISTKMVFESVFHVLRPGGWWKISVFFGAKAIEAANEFRKVKIGSAEPSQVVRNRRF